ncbi:MAG: ribosome biogenesis GTPase Der [Rhodospirillales bacterium]|nr:ribosome biogenesis GTPase Der [Rhodospirillales bacterium]
MPLTVAILGRPNVGKSTLFNRLVGKRLAIVDNSPGVTRDRREGEARIGDLRFTVIDTAGLTEATGEGLEAMMRAQTDRAVEEADVILMVIDARAGITPLDEHFAVKLRQKGTPVILAANKCEGSGGKSGLIEAYALGLGEALPLSAEHGEGLSDLYDALRPYVEEISRSEEENAALAPGEPKPGQPLQLAIVGRPNVGKSTLVNNLLGKERMLTGPEAGITRDSIASAWTFKGQEFQLIDTAGLRRKARISEKIEELSTSDTLRTIRFAQLVVLVLDGDDMLEKQDLTIASLVIEEGRALVIAVNKWDKVKDKKEALGRLNDRLQTSLPQVRGIPVVTLSALTGKGLENLLPTVMKTYHIWNKHISTGRLNAWLKAVTEQHPPPMSKGKRIRLRYITQAKTRPPTFAVFASRAKDLPQSYARYLVNALRDTFDLPGVPIRLYLRKGKNPYVDGK